MNKFLNKLIGYLEISNFERGGLLALLFCVLSVSGYYYFANTYTPNLKSIEVDEAKLLAFEKYIDSLDKAQKEQKKSDSKFSNTADKEYSLQIFNPAKDDIKSLKSKGVPPRVAHTIINFREKGGTFRYKEDLKKLYVVNDEVFAKLQAYIDLPNKPQIIDKTSDMELVGGPEKKGWVVKNIALNSADASELEKLPGIGKFYAKNIIEYRDKLGGYMNIDQLYEVYKMKEETVNNLKGILTISPDAIRKIDINNATFKELVAHPYLSYNQVKAIVSYREQHQGIQTLEEFKSLHIFRGEDISRLLPYLDLN